MATASEELNRQSVQRLFNILYGIDPDFDAIDDIVAEDYIQHHAAAGQGRRGLKEYFAKLMPLPEGTGAEAIVTVNHIAEGDFVVRQENRHEGLLIDVFRAKDGLLLEHWDAYRPAPGTDRLSGF